MSSSGSTAVDPGGSSDDRDISQRPAGVPGTVILSLTHSLVQHKCIEYLLCTKRCACCLLVGIQHKNQNGAKTKIPALTRMMF